VSQDGSKLSFGSDKINAAVSKAFSGSVNVNGTTVQVTAKAVEAAPGDTKDVNTITVVRDTQGVTTLGRSETNKVGGDKVTVGATGEQAATPTTVTHEMGHTAGAGDQYKAGVDVNGNKIDTDTSSSPNIMHDLSGAPANSQTLGEIIKSPANVNTCAPGVSAANGRC